MARQNGTKLDGAHVTWWPWGGWVRMLDPHAKPEQTALDIPERPPVELPPFVDAEAVDLVLDEPTVEEIPRVGRAPRWPLPRPRQIAIGGPRRISKRQSRALASALLVLLLIALVVAVWMVRQPVVQYATAQTGTLETKFSATGTLQSASYAANFVATGKLAEIDVSVGQQVNQGDTLAKLDTTLLNDAVNEAQQGVNSAQQKLSDAQNNLQKVQAAEQAVVSQAYDTEQSKLTSSSCDNSCTQQAQDAYAAAQAQADAANSQAQLTVDDAQAALNTAQARLQTAHDDLSNATLTAPHSGTISAINQTVGSTIVGSSATAPVTNFMTIADLGTLQIRSTVAVGNVAGVVKGDVVNFTVPSVPGTFKGQVDGVSPSGTMVQNVLTYPMTVDVDMATVSAAHLFPGMPANLSVITLQKPGVLLIPASAVQYARAAADTKHGGFLPASQVAKALETARNDVAAAQDASAFSGGDQPTPAYVLQFVKGKWVTVPVLLGISDGRNYEVLQGLTAGERVVTGETNGPVSIPSPAPTPSR